MNQQMKVICAGFPKTGTKSLTKALQILGYNNIYDYLEHVVFFMDDYLELLQHKKSPDFILDKYEQAGVDCVIDMPPSFLFEQFHNRWPNAKVILTVREEEAWFKSIKKMNDTMVNSHKWMVYLSPTAQKFERFMRLLYTAMMGSPLECDWLWTLHYRSHNTYVQSTIQKSNLLVFNVADGWDPLCKFLGKPVPSEDFPRENFSGSKGNILERLLSSPIYYRARNEATLRVVTFSALGVACYFGYKRYLQ